MTTRNILDQEFGDEEGSEEDFNPEQAPESDDEGDVKLVTNGDAAEKPSSRSASRRPAGGSDGEDELKDAMENHDPSVAHATGGQDIDDAMAKKHGKKGHKIVNFFKGTVKATIETSLVTTSTR